jgi:hypothetical protein
MTSCSRGAASVALDWGVDPVVNRETIRDQRARVGSSSSFLKSQTGLEVCLGHSGGLALINPAVMPTMEGDSVETEAFESLIACLGNWTNSVRALEATSFVLG